MISKCELVFFSHFRMNANLGTCLSRLFLAHLSHPFQDGYNTCRNPGIVSMANPGKRNKKLLTLKCLLQSFL